jgi:transcriptional regulator with XRE-family HTH domain
MVEVERRARRRLQRAIDDCRLARLRSGITQRQVADALDCSRQLITALEAGRIGEVGVTQLSRYAAAVGLDLSLNTYPAERLLRDVGQIRLLKRFGALIDDGWTWRTEVPVSADPRDLRAIDAVIARGEGRVGVEAITRFVDAQGQVRPVLLKQEASGLGCMILLLGDTRHNRAAVDVAGAMLRADFPLRARELLADLRAGRQPSANGLLLA